MAKEKDINVQEEEKEVLETPTEATEEAPENVEETPENEAPQEPTWEEKYNEMNNKFLRLYADFENLRKRSAKEKLDILQSANGNLIKELLPIVDDFDRAIANNKESDDIEAVKEGFNLINDKFFKTLEKQGLKPMDAKEKVFDTDHHEAITNIPAPTEDLKGKVVDVIEKGYFINDKVLRFAKVVVGQ